MKYLITFLAFAAYGLLITGCIKNKDYSPTDHTAGITGMRKWSGTAYGICRFDSSWLDQTKNVVQHKILPRNYKREISDSLFELWKIDNFTIKVFGYWMGYSWDSSGFVIFDSAYISVDKRYLGSVERSFVKLNSSNKQMEMVLNIMGDQEYQDHWSFHTVD